MAPSPIGIEFRERPGFVGLRNGSISLSLAGDGDGQSVGVKMLQNVMRTCGIVVALSATSTVGAQTTAASNLPVAIVQSQVDAFNKGDVEAFASVYAEDVELFDLGPEAKPSLSGRAALIARYKPMLTRYHPKATVLSRMEAGSFVIDKERTEAAGRSSEGIAIYEVKDGKIRRVWFTP